MRIDLLKWSADYLNDILNVYNNIDRSYLSDRIPEPYTGADAMSWIDFVSKNDGIKGIYRMIVVDGVMVGSVSLEFKEDVFRCDAELGYLISSDHCNNGIGTEAVSMICDGAFANFDLSRITALVDEPNLASRRVLEKNGFVLEGLMNNAVIKNGQYFNLCIYGKLR